MTDAAPTRVRDAKKDEVRARITDALIELLAEGVAGLNHEVLAQRARGGRRPG